MAQPAARAVQWPEQPLVFGWSDVEGAFLLEVSAANVRATLAGRELPAERIRRNGASVQVLDAEGLVAGQVQPTRQGGTLQTFPERHRVVLGVRLIASEDAAAADRGAARGAQEGRVAAGLRRVVAVTPGSAAAKAGVQPDDLLVEAGGLHAITEPQLRSLLAAKRPGQRLPLRVLRGGRELALEAVLERSAPQKQGTEQRQGGIRTPLVTFDGNRMFVLRDEAAAQPRGGVPVRTSAELDAAADELERMQEQLEALDELLQRAIEFRQRTGRRDADGGGERGDGAGGKRD
jgi:hypothetical protein